MNTYIANLKVIIGFALDVSCYVNALQTETTESGLSSIKIAYCE